ncbi:hypothetical protein [uncultured Ruminococcus sp.]|uniref:hypothetical protein n=1 Tax=uncultured Ruminococcus sp. TaxID=165186 RepID=UPI002931052E|nr:hypothetical protein [uncultured Ruminococcus sp.]
MNISFAGFKENVLTFECTNTVKKGDLVKMSASGKVTKAAANDSFIGVCVGENDGYAAVQLEGYVEAAKSGTVNVGYAKLAATATGVKAAESGIDRLVIYTDDSTVGFIL